MDTGTFGAVVTVLFFLLFIVILWWAFRRENKQKFEDAANLPFQEDARETGKRRTD
ncbi:MAG: CcoQ/FixQ family Cbb3-type cytochrome c oxidase assembly chaperone [Hydrogenophilales bacterium CG_4_9_14_3_um_filter_63_34]|nr:MAG: CcoQ/FixQ family Cbb3-type cytochrome c oxidase assembly chaperone [Hydrogenophilales bacterium CG_4_10_14_3_um_filter_63_21]PJB03163.1 MAG: CcoQ/FixQ family Cbb3-type cytochrome c oxidase assembly chaperone [Hydrogenophilales bacterium CG_4_9_14_3_um_filter_63_34]